MDGIIDEECNLDVDTLTEGKPMAMELIPQHRRDVIKLPFVRDQPSCRVQDRLQSSHNDAWSAVEDAVAIVNMAIRSENLV